MSNSTESWWTVFWGLVVTGFQLVALGIFRVVGNLFGGKK